MAIVLHHWWCLWLRWFACARLLLFGSPTKINNLYSALATALFLSLTLEQFPEHICLAAWIWRSGIYGSFINVPASLKFCQLLRLRLRSGWWKWYIITRDVIVFIGYLIRDMRSSGPINVLLLLHPIIILLLSPISLKLFLRHIFRLYWRVRLILCLIFLLNFLPV